MSNLIFEDADDILSEEEEEREYSRKELLASNPFALVAWSKRRLRYMALFDVENWFEQLQDFTFPTAVATVTWDEAIAVMHFYQEGTCKHHGKITDDDEQAIAQLRCKIDALFLQLRSGTSEHPGFFVRLGPRSPKDAPMQSSEPHADLPPSRACLCGLSKARLIAALNASAYQLEFEKQSGQSSDSGTADACDVLRCFQDVCLSLLRVTTSAEALQLLLSSSRVMQDISHTRDKGNRGWSMSVVAREWDPDVSLGREFRTFVVAGNVVAISQYDDQLAYPYVVNNTEQIVTAIIDCLRLAKPKLDELSFATANMAIVVDVLVTPAPLPSSPWPAKVIELTPFGPMTGASLFQWNSDRRILQGGKDLFGDLDDCERKCPPGSLSMPSNVDEQIISGIPFRYNLHHKPFDWQHLHAYWEDYVRLAPPSILASSALLDSASHFVSGGVVATGDEKADQWNPNQATLKEKSRKSYRDRSLSPDRSSASTIRGCACTELYGLCTDSTLALA
eukprot:CAMPEP_0172844236 /NCGR_PEP_ID=MMETSP1075-20121228/32049_1 /TAXON_ID=2916 /ORGANISM="Ceratium fusus, Strain PA161109" /LENGTH=506 /DNA_ID=CAMNT_0013688633 /DNA_START=35 /DNA_END=1554 /DNA_ORIENTATION=-